MKRDGRAVVRWQGTTGTGAGLSHRTGTRSPLSRTTRSLRRCRSHYATRWRLVPRPHPPICRALEYALPERPTGSRVGTDPGVPPPVPRRLRNGGRTTYPPCSPGIAGAPVSAARGELPSRRLLPLPMCRGWHQGWRRLHGLQDPPCEPPEEPGVLGLSDRKREPSASRVGTRTLCRRRGWGESSVRHHASRARSKPIPVMRPSADAARLAGPSRNVQARPRSVRERRSPAPDVSPPQALPGLARLPRYILPDPRSLPSACPTTDPSARSRD